MEVSLFADWGIPRHCFLDIRALIIGQRTRHLMNAPGARKSSRNLNLLKEIACVLFGVMTFCR